MNPLDTVVAAVQADFDKAHQIAHGADTESVVTDNGNVSSVAKAKKDTWDGKKTQADADATSTEGHAAAATQSATNALTSQNTATTNRDSIETIANQMTLDAATAAGYDTAITAKVTEIADYEATALAQRNIAQAKETEVSGYASQVTASLTTTATKMAEAATSATAVTASATDAASRVTSGIPYANPGLTIMDARVMEASTGTGAADLLLGGAVSGTRSLSSAVADQEWFKYKINGVDGSLVPTSEWEEGWGFTLNGYLIRSVVTASSNNGYLVKFSAGTKHISLLKKHADTNLVEVSIPCVPPNTANGSAGWKGMRVMSGAYKIVGVRASVNTASSSGSVRVTLSVNGYDILSTYLTVDATKKTSVGSTVQPVILDDDLVAGDRVGVYLFSGGTGSKGLNVTLLLRPAPVDYMQGLAKRWTAGDLANFVSRTTAAWYFDSTGTLQQAATNTGRLNYDPSTLTLKGLLMEEARTNSIRNNTMAGYVPDGTVNLAPNGTFDSGITGWTGSSTGTGTAGWNAGYQCLELTSTVLGDTGSVDYAMPTAIGTSYFIRFFTRSESTSRGGVTVGNSAGGSGLGNQNGTIGGYTTVVFTATATTTYIRLKNLGTETGVCYVDNVEILTSGSNPTNWASISASTPSFLRTLLAKGIENGIDYIDIRFQFAANINVFVVFESLTGVAAAQNENWAGSCFVSLAAGALGTTTMDMAVSERSSSALIAESVTAFTPTSAALRTQRILARRTMGDPTTANVTLGLRIFGKAGSDFTLRIGLPQLEKVTNATDTASSPIKTLGSVSVIREDDQLIMGGTAFSTWFNSSEYSLYSEGTARGSVGSLSAYVRLSDSDNSSTTNRHEHMYVLATQKCMVATVTSGTVVMQSTEADNTTPPGTARKKIASAVKTNDGSSSFGGASNNTDSNLAMPVLDRIHIGWGGLIQRQQINDHMNEVRFYRTRLPNWKLRRMTT